MEKSNEFTDEHTPSFFKNLIRGSVRLKCKYRKFSRRKATNAQYGLILCSLIFYLLSSLSTPSCFWSNSGNFIHVCFCPPTKCFEQTLCPNPGSLKSFREIMCSHLFLRSSCFSALFPLGKL